MTNAPRIQIETACGGSRQSPTPTATGVSLYKAKATVAANTQTTKNPANNRFNVRMSDARISCRTLPARQSGAGGLFGQHAVVHPFAQFLAGLEMRYVLAGQ